MESQIIELKKSRLTGNWQYTDRSQLCRRLSCALGKWALAVVIAACLMVAKILRVTMFSLLLWLRRPVRATAGIFAFGGLLGFPMMFLGVADAHPFKTAMVWSCVGVFFLGGLLAWYYDELLLRLSPRPLILC